MLRKFFLDLFFPSFCLGCNKEGSFICYDCRSTMEISEHNYCLCRQKPIRLPPGSQNGRCYRCRDKRLSGLFSALPYKEKFLTRKLIYQLKYPPYIKALAKASAEIITEHLISTKNNTEKVWQNSLLAPVPMEKSKMKGRGYNQAAELAKELSEIIKVPVILDNLIKNKKTLPQMELDAKKRAENIKGAFLVKNSSEIRGKKIFLVDDVYTTGATMEECAKILKEADARSVWGIVIAREG